MKPTSENDPAEEPRPGNGASRVKRHYLLALSLVAIAVLVNFGLMQVSLQIQESKVRLSALVSEQSRLLVDIGTLTRSLMQGTAEGNLPETSLDNLRRRITEKAARARSNLAEILDLDVRGMFGLFGPGSVAEFYTKPPHMLAQKLIQVIERSEGIVQLDTQRLRNRLRYWSAIDIVMASGTLMQEEFDAAMAESYRTSQQHIVVLQVVEAVVTTTALVLIVLEALCIFAPLVRRLKREHDQTILYQRKLWDQSRQDHLTGLRNRTAFGEKLRSLIQSHEEGGSPFAVILFDLDGFKPINDMLGHAAGDILLRAVGLRASEAAGSEAVVARLGGDEFGVLLKGLADVEAVQGLIDRLKAAIEQPTRCLDHDVKPSVSFGAALFPDHAVTAEAILGAADVALYAAKTGRGNSKIYDEAMRAEADTSRQLAIDLKRGLAQGELTAFYQPQVQLADGRLVGFEALIRWQHPTLGLLAPARFLPVVERHGLMMEITAFMIDRVGADISSWLKAGYDPVTVLVNVSQGMLASDVAIEVFTSALDRHGLSYDRIGIEVTEDVLLDRNAIRIRETLEAFRALGVTVSFDDFGTGYASLTHLKAFPFDELKIDRSFVSDLPNGAMSGEIVRSLIGIARAAGKSVVAEGIETVAQRDLLIKKGCPVGQGYLFSRPVPVEQATDMLRAAGTPALAHFGPPVRDFTYPQRLSA